MIGSVKAWAARDKNGDIYIYGEKPKKGDEEWYVDDAESVKDSFIPFLPGLFDDLQWTDKEPREVELTIKPKEEPIVEKIRVSRHVQDLFNLECVKRVIKMPSGKVNVDFNLEYMRDCDFMAEEGDWICRTASGKWIVKKGGEE